MNDFAGKVITTAASGDPSAVTKLAAADASNTEAQANALVSFAKGWDTGVDKVSTTHDAMGLAQVTATKHSNGSMKYEIAWLNDHWILMIGTRASSKGPTTPASP